MEQAGDYARPVENVTDRFRKSSELLDRSDDGQRREGEGSGQSRRETLLDVVWEFDGFGAWFGEESAGDLACEVEETVTQGDAEHGEHDTEDDGMPAVGLTGFNGGEIALDDPGVAQRTEPVQLALADAEAGLRLMAHAEVATPFEVEG